MTEINVDRSFSTHTQRHDSKNAPINAKLWATCQSEAKRKFRIHPSAFSNGYASKIYKERGGKWRSDSLKEWFSEDWKAINSSGKIVGGCGDGETKGKVKCLPASKSRSLSKKDRSTLARRKQKQDPNPNREGAPVMVSSKKRGDSMTPEVFAQAILSIEQNYGLRLDARSVWLRMDDWKRLGRDQMGQKCGRGWYGLRGACKRGKKGADNSAAIKESKVALADKIRKKKGLRDRNAPKAKAPKVERIKPSATRATDTTKSLESVVSKKVATELRIHPDKAKVKNLTDQIESINSEKAKDSFSDEDAVGFRKRSQSRNKQLEGIKGELKKLHKTVQANKPQTLEDRAKGILEKETKLEKMHYLGHSRAQSTTREAIAGNLGRVRNSAKAALARDARELLSQGKSVPSSVLKVLGSFIDYTEKGEYEPISKRSDSHRFD